MDTAALKTQIAEATGIPSAKLYVRKGVGSMRGCVLLQVKHMSGYSLWDNSEAIASILPKFRASGKEQGWSEL